jgi:hypothetical protein
MKLRALIGEWDHDKVIFLGAVEVDIYEAICEDDDCEGTSRWEDRKEQWLDTGPHGIEETREIEIDLDLPGDLFATPQAVGRLSETTQ